MLWRGNPNTGESTALRYQHATAERGAEIAAKLNALAASTRPERVARATGDVANLR
jgi:hypothetical protein